MSRPVWVFLALCVISGSGTPGHAQSDQAVIVGRVVDATDAPIPGASVAATFVATGRLYETRADEAGNFRIAEVPAGEYTLIVSNTGFKNLRYTVTIRADTSNNAGYDGDRLLLRLEVGTVTNSVQVTAGATGGRAPEQMRKRALVTVHYATDRKPSGNSDPYLFYTGLRSSEAVLSYGTCLVSIPPHHRPGELEEPSLLQLEFRPDKKKHVVLLDVLPATEQAFFANLRDNVLKTRRKEILVFIHGYRTSFDNAVRRTAQITYDLNFDGVPVLYSWPSEDRILNYKVDEGNVEWTTPRLESFLTAVAKVSGADRIYLIAHSMGNRALTRAMSTLSARRQTWVRDKFRELILAAPDIDAGVFRDLAAEFTKVAGRTTLYASANDKALRLSQKLARYVRAGQTGGDVVIVPGIETIDVSDVDTSFLGHSYFGENRSVLSDIFRILQLGQPAEQRCGLSSERITYGTYWKFRKELSTLCPRPQ